MRITGGTLGGRILKAPRGSAVRPTQDRVREALFSMLAAGFPGWRVLDLFAGSGAVGFEALSRGAAEVVWVERDRRACALISENCRDIAAVNGRVVCADARRWVRGAGAGAGFDLVFADPPYAAVEADGFGSLMADLRQHVVVRTAGWFVGEQPRRAMVATVDGWELVRDREYGHTRLVIYRNMEIHTSLPA